MELFSRKDKNNADIKCEKTDDGKLICQIKVGGTYIQKVVSVDPGSKSLVQLSMQTHVEKGDEGKVKSLEESLDSAIKEMARRSNLI